MRNLNLDNAECLFTPHMDEVVNCAVERVFVGQKVKLVLASPEIRQAHHPFIAEWLSLAKAVRGVPQPVPNPERKEADLQRFLELGAARQVRRERLGGE